MDELLTWEEIERRFAGEWVVIDDLEVTAELEIVRGRVVYHGKDRDEAELQATAKGLKSFTVWYVGERIPEGTVVIL